MDFALLYWHWIVLGIVMIIAEIFLGSFFIFWFGAAAVFVGLLLILLPELSETHPIIIWAITSAASDWSGITLITPLTVDKTKAGLSREALVGEIGQVLKVPTGEKRGTVRFPAPVLGSDEWLIISQDDLDIGDRVSVVDLSGNSLIVIKA